MTHIISEIMGKKVSIEIDQTRFRPFDVETLVCNFDRAQKLLSWKPEISINEGLKRTIEWSQKENLDIGVPFNERYEME